MLHILNGDATLDRLRGTGLPGDLLVWRDILMEGPVPNGLTSMADWEERATYLEDRLSIPRATYLEGITGCLRRLAAVSGEDEVVLWFEEDLFCQIHLVFLLDRLSARRLGATRLTLVCSPERLGENRPEALTALFARRELVTPARRALAREAWAAYSSGDPRRLEALLAGDVSPWPLLRRGILCHLERLPSLSNGLNAVEEASLRAVLAHPRPFPELFAAVTREERVLHHGMGDTQLAVALRELGSGDRPLVTLGAASTDSVGTWRVAATSRAQEVLGGRSDAIALRGIDRWLGGIRLATGGPLWRWDGAARRAVAGA